MHNYKPDFTKFIHATNVTGSKKAASYIRALDLLSQMLATNPQGMSDCKNIWTVNSVNRLHELYLVVLDESRKKDRSVWNIDGLPKSYLQNGYCSAAIKAFQSFLVEFSYEQSLLTTLSSEDFDESTRVEDLNLNFQFPEYLVDDIENMSGENVIRAVKARVNQNVFRKKILEIYRETCCITGLNIPEINRASHIIPWADDEKKRLDPRNGLCLSATYDAAFDRNLISLDEDYRIIVSKDIKDHYCNESVKEYFAKKEGDAITLPSSFLPHKDYLSDHRNKGSF